MAFYATESYPRLANGGIRSLDHMEAGVCNNAKCVPCPHRVRMHGTRSKVRSTYDLVHAWGVVAVTSSTAGAAITIFASRGKW